LNCTPKHVGDQPKIMKWAVHVARIGARRGAYRILVGRHDGKRPLGRHAHRREDNPNLDIQGVRGGGWTGLIWLRLGTGSGIVRMW
jgi:hypothetical protein